MANEPNSKTYWAVEPDSKKAVGEVVNRIRDFRDNLQSTNRLNSMRRNWNAYVGMGPNGDKARTIQFGGARGEILEINPNQFAALLNQVVVLTTSSKPAVKCIAATNDYKATADCIVGDSVLEHYDRELDTDEHESQVVRDMLLLSEAWSILDWDTTLGRDLMRDENGRVKKEGDLAQYNLTAADVGYDHTTSDTQRTWVAWRRPVSKWELAAQYPLMRDKILAESDRETIFDGNQGFTWRNATYRGNAQDTVWLWEVRHRPTMACPNGRLIKFLSDDCVLFDTISTSADGQVSDFGYPFGADLYAFRVVPEKLSGTGEPHTLFFDLLSLQEGLDLAATIMATVVNAGGMQNWLVPVNANVTPEQMQPGVNFIKYGGDKAPELSEQMAISPAVSEWADRCIDWMRQRSAVNDVVMGETKSGMPAQMAALMRAEAIEYHSAGQRAYERFIQAHRSAQIALLQKYATSERVARIVGKGSKWAVTQWSADKLASIDSVQVESVSAASRSYAGRLALADRLLDKGLVEDAQQYVSTIETGRVDPIMRYAVENKARIQAERELLMRGVGLPPLLEDPVTGKPAVSLNGLPLFADTQGEFVRPLKCDSHDTDIREYQAVLANPGARSDQKVVKAVLEVIDYKQRLWQSLSPDELVMFHLPPLPSQTGQMPMPGDEPPKNPGSERSKPPEEQIAADGVEPSRPVMAAQPPPNPLTGEQAPAPV